MGKMIKLLSVLAAAVLFLAVFYLGVRVFASIRQGYSWEEMDWNQDGHTTLREFLASSDIGKRLANRDGRKCTEYYSFKDGLPVKTVCPK